MCVKRIPRIKIRADSQFIRYLNQAADIVAKHFAQHFVFHGRVGLAANVIPELPFNHADRGFHVRPLVIVGQKFGTVELEIVIHLLL